ncbi:hypothetical protein BK816_00455 [Boudabousia tangfeifanii]|uniref:Peptidase S9 prolyl oligopeptidase catalytic domain-containing protein n=1 Tax=Boudabousia tangfeifanii TaxID=1912795 RepID=A0A1D9MID2_9ACTO|nr:YqiA/YcfP family alpha/beta fold hydrolase [Boudabousia tangfeifanii]AOZ71949.1 hypothetical protein BK816_00455 [Boudabousia tangfeifanii]
MIEYRINRKREIDKTNNVTWFYHDFSSFLSSDIKSGINTIFDNGVPIDFFLDLKKSNVLIVVFHGAVLDENIHLPWLSGTNISYGLDASRLSISDPSLYLAPDIKVGWFIGNKHQQNLQNTIVRLIRKIANDSGIERIVFIGGSAGGYASLYFSSFFPGSYAVVYNPQISIENHRYSMVREYLIKCWDGREIYQIVDSENPPCFDISSRYQEDRSNHVLYFQNNDDFHLNLHRDSFEYDEGNDIKFFIGNWGDGHAPLPKDALKRILIMLLKSFESEDTDLSTAISNLISNL